MIRMIQGNPDITMSEAHSGNNWGYTLLSDTRFRRERGEWRRKRGKCGGTEIVWVCVENSEYVSLSNGKTA